MILLESFCAIWNDASNAQSEEDSKLYYIVREDIFDLLSGKCFITHVLKKLPSNLRITEKSGLGNLKYDGWKSIKNLPIRTVEFH